jgi:hypothetical protein
MDSTLHFLYIYHLYFHLKKKKILQALRLFYGVTSFSMYSLVEIIFHENQDGICFLWDLELWILTIQPSHSCTLAYCRPIHLISIEFQNIDNNLDFPPNFLFFFTFNCYNLVIHVVTLTEIFSTKYQQSKVQDLMVGSRKTSSHF